MHDLTQHEPDVMMPVAGRPFINYIVESLVDSGAGQIDVILSDLPEKIETSLGDGTRWGITIRYQLARDPVRPYGRLAILGVGDDESIVLAHGDRLPLWKFDSSKTVPELVFQNGEWTGWGVLTGALVRSLSDDLDEAALSRELSASVQARSDAPVVLSVRSFEDLLEANWAVLEKRFPNLLLTGREASEGIWISRNVSLHPTASITAPVYVGENCRINAGVQLGPRVAVGNNCLVDLSTVLSETVVFHGSYLGQHLELRHAIVDRNRLVNIKIGAAITVADNFILGSFVEHHHFTRLVGRVAWRVLATLLLVLAWPFLVLAWIWCKLTRRGPALCRKTVVRLPVSGSTEYRNYNLMSLCASPGIHTCAGAAHELFLHFIPGLVNVAAGHLSLVGVAPRNAAELDAMSPDWRKLCLGSTAGLITEAYVMHGAAPDEDQLYSAEVFYAATASAKQDIKLVFFYLGKLLGVKRREEPAESSSELEDY
jgi:NDP-sugar pyrophosphorylase family protein